MNPRTVPPSEDRSSTYLHHLEDLIAEMAVGMEAISANSIETLKQSVARQEVLCATLSNATCTGGDHLRELSQSAFPLSEDAVEVTIWKASNTIRQLNLQYEALLRHSGKSIAMLTALCNNHTGRSTEPQSSWSKQQTWSCKI